MKRAKKIRIIHFESLVDFDIPEPVAPGIFTDVEREIIRADMAYLIQKEIDNGDRAKWEESQKRIGASYNDQWLTPVNMHPAAPPEPIPNRSLTIEPYIDRARFLRCVGREPTELELDQCNCVNMSPGHVTCGWCRRCNKPRFICRHYR